MKIRYTLEPLVYAECAALISKLFFSREHEEDKTEAYDPTEYLKGFAERRQLSFASVACYANALSGLYSDIGKLADSIPEEHRHFFFHSVGNGTNALAATLAIALDHGIRLRSVEDPVRRERMQFHLALGTVSDEGYPNNETNIYTEENFLKCLDECGAEAAERWNAWSVYRRTDYYLDLLEKLLEPFAALYRKHLPGLQPLFEETIRLAKANLAENPKEAFAQYYFISLDVEELTIRPQTATMLGASMWIMDPSLGVANQFVVGCCFDALRTLWFGSENLVNGLTAQIKALDDKRRFQILTALKEKPLCGQEICALTGLSPATVSHHMNELVSARFVSLEKVGTRINYQLRTEVIGDFLENLKRILM